MKKRSILVLIVMVLLTLGFFGVMKVLSKLEANLQRVAKTTIHDVDLSTASNGDHVGSYSAFPVSAEVKVIINNHVIKRIELVKHDNGHGKSAEVLPNQVVSAQSLSVDCISGATYSSKVILKAIENALTNAGAKTKPIQS